jgi:hypothetical protein
MRGRRTQVRPLTTTDSEVDDFTIEEDDRIFMTMVHLADPHHFVHALSTVSGVMSHIRLTLETAFID